MRESREPDYRMVEPVSNAEKSVRPSLAASGQLKAPKGKFRLIGVDTFEAPDADFLVGDFTDKKEAITEAEKRAGRMRPMYVYDSDGKLIFNAGRP